MHSLTSSPTIENGVLSYQDSPLVRAVSKGYILVIDEADKAPTQVTSILKGLVEDGELLLGDGRKIVPEKSPISGTEIIRMHGNFRMIVLAVFSFRSFR